MKTTIAPTASGDGVTLPPDVLRASGLEGEVDVTVEPGRVVITNGPAGLPHETPEERAARGRKMREALDKLAEIGAFASIEDPVAWQREIRRDRPLPGREAL